MIYNQKRILIMRKILPITLFITLNSACFAMTPIVTLPEGWMEKGIPIVVNDPQDYFYADLVCPPEIVITPSPCGARRTQGIYMQNSSQQIRM